MLNLNSTAGQAPNYAKVFEATAKDEQKVAELFEVVLSTDEERNVALSLRGADAESFMDALQHILDENKQCPISRDSSLRSAMQKLLIQLSKRSTNLPETMFISGVEPVTSKRYLGGTFGDVYTSVYQGKNVALKMLRTFQTQADKSRIYRRFCKEALIWHKLEHEFVIPFLGIDAENFPRQPCMVSPWMVNGTLNQFLRKNPRCNLDKLLYQIIQGVDYLHSKGVVHGDLKGGNILIDENCDPRLADFGLTIFAEATMQSTTDHGGTLRWMAPELLYAHGEPQRRSFASDIYAYACVCVEVYTGNAPFADIRNEGQVITQILQGARPPRPEKMTSDSLWKIVKHCWQVDKDARPKSRKVVNALRELMKSKRNTGTLDGVETYGRRLDVPGRPFTPFATLEDPSSLRSGRTTRWVDQDVDDEHTQCLKRVRRHADPHRMYHHLELLQQNSSVNLFVGRIKGTNSAVTVKQVDSRQSGLTKRLSRLIDEYQDMRFLHHPNILNYVDLFQHDNHIWIVMDSMKKSVPLSKLLERTTQSGGLKDSFLANVIRHITQAVHYLHRHGIVHGSISSENVLLGTGKNLTARLKLAVMIDDPNATSHKGTLPAPEARQGTPGPEADIWDLGLLGIAMWDSHIDLTRERDDLLLEVLQNPTPPTIPMRSYLNQTLNVKLDLRPTAASLLQHPFLCNVGTMRSGQKDSSGLNRSLTDPKQRSRELLSSSQVGRSRTSRR
ncbi:hypothetical protein PM082_016694 [Marasmius tenuissimus]|nr:hypothetical protein PM082_016694 [Marasmius tenuissimus]